MKYSELKKAEEEIVTIWGTTFYVTTEPDIEEEPICFNAEHSTWRIYVSISENNSSMLGWDAETTAPWVKDGGSVFSMSDREVWSPELCGINDDVIEALNNIGY